MQRPATNAQSASAETPVLLRGDIDGIALLTLNRPDTRNALSETMLTALAEALASIAADSKVRALVIAGNGPAFCAGHDLKEITERRSDPDAGRAYVTDLMTRCSAMMQAIVALPQPVIAAVGGVATAAGCQLVASCDLAIASTGARFATPGVHIGLFCTTPGVALARNVTAKHAMEMLLTGDMISAEDAVRMGLVNRAVAPGSEREEALKLARKIVAKSAMTVTMGKRAFYRQREMPLAEAYRYASDVMIENLLKHDAEEGIRAFVEKRDPKWEDR